MRPPGLALEVLLAFLALGVTSFGGPIAHLGYFRSEFVLRRRWLDERAYAELVSLCQLLPGPASSQVAICVGIARAGYFGGLAAWIGFALPSAILLVLFAYGAGQIKGRTGIALLHGLELVAVPIVAQAVWGMAQTLCPDRRRAFIALAGVLILLFMESAARQLVVILAGGVLGLWLCRAADGFPAVAYGRPLVSRRLGVCALISFFLLLVGLPLLVRIGSIPGVALVDAFYRSGALVFGGGHVVLPLLHDAFVTPGWITEDAFLAGYGAAQAIPGPLFTFAAYLGAIGHPTPHGVAGALVGLVGIFLPGALLLLGALPFWESLRRLSSARAAMAGVNASVVGLLAVALYSPVWTSSVRTAGDIVVAGIGFGLLVFRRAAPLLVVAGTAVATVILAYLQH